MRISVKQWFADEGLTTKDARLERLEEIVSEGVAPALCEDGCEVEPDGECEHGCSSILIALGYI